MPRLVSRARVVVPMKNPCLSRGLLYLAERGGSSQPDPKSLILLQDANQERVLFCVPTL